MGRASASAPAPVPADADAAAALPLLLVKWPSERMLGVEKFHPWSSPYQATLQEVIAEKGVNSGI